ncbi:hypothetical protein GCM10025791_06210 [Halioxenophilus aromaticivorans]|uniref:Uncharacterized protein n=2 Tax=Halioxenophilus aromaticivorans TaxID=1306992 RepID=A0AAV3TXN8_9ALTE
MGLAGRVYQFRWHHNQGTKPDANSVLGDIVLGVDTPQDYLEKSPYMGAIIGRYGNRIRDGKFQLGSQAY